MKNTTLCYIEKDGCYLMLHRVKKKADVNKGKWIGFGGHFEPGESPDECVMREVREETGLTLTSYRYRGIVTFCADNAETELMHLFTADSYEGTLTDDCNEGIIAWQSKGTLHALPMWEGDYIFLDLLRREVPFFSLKLVYVNDKLTKAVLNGQPLPSVEDFLKEGSESL
jgi:8-oxo-dGTP diphosphatase